MRRAEITVHQNEIEVYLRYENEAITNICNMEIDFQVVM